MFICRECYLKQEPEKRDERFSEWEIAPKSYGPCELCENSTLCADL